MVALDGLVLVLTGIPAFAVLIAAAVIGACGAGLIGGVPAAVLGSLSARLIHLLESDLLQALPLYVSMP